MELLTLGKASIIVPDYRQAEQENNASRLAQLEVSEVLSYPELGQGGLLPALEKLLTQESYYQRALQFKEQAKELQGARQTAQLLMDYAQRLIAY